MIIFKRECYIDITKENNRTIVAIIAYDADEQTMGMLHSPVRLRFFKRCKHTSGSARRYTRRRGGGEEVKKGGYGEVENLEERWKVGEEGIGHG